MTDSAILIYQTEDEQINIQGDTVWLIIDQMADLFQKSRSTINEHILNIYEEELQKDVSMRKIGKSDFSTKPTNNLNVRVGYDWILSKSKKSLNGFR